MSIKIEPKGFFATNNYGVYFYLIGSLLFYFQMIQNNEVHMGKALTILIIFILFSLFLVYYIQPNFHK
jgi:hypothetical protein